MKVKILRIFKKKSIIIGTIVLVVIGCLYDNNNESQGTLESESSNSKSSIENKILICDGINVTENCELDGIQYSLYKYYPAVEEVSHMETITTYTQEITGYCTLCNDGTYSPTCATGRGACSHHGGVAQWDAPVYSKVAHNEQKKVIDFPAVTERYEKIEKN